MSKRRQVSTMEAIAATFGPASGLPMCSQFLRPRASGRMAPSHQLCRLQPYAAWQHRAPVFPRKLQDPVIAAAA